MLIKDFFIKLKKELQLLSIPRKGKVFNKNVYICATFPMIQISTIISPLCLILDYGSQPHKSHPNIQHQTFGVFSWIDNVTDQFGDSAVQELQSLENVVHSLIVNLLGLDGEKLSILALKKNAITITVNNTPCLFRGWVYSVILEI